MNDHSLFFVRKFKLIKALTSMSVWIFMPKLTIALRKNIQNIWILTLELVKNADFLTARKREALAVLQVAVIVGVVVVVRTFVLIELYDAILLWISKSDSESECWVYWVCWATRRTLTQFCSESDFSNESAFCNKIVTLEIVKVFEIEM